MNALVFCLSSLGIGLIVCVVRGQSREIAPLASSAAAVILMGALLKYALPLVEEIKTISSSFSGTGEYAALILKALGVALTAGTCADVCRDCGENAVAAKIDSAGRIGILLLALPVLRSVIEVIKEFI